MQKILQICKKMYRHCFLAIDIGATSGREVVATGCPDGTFTFREIHRFPNSIINISGRYCWDIFSIYSNIIEGLKICSREGIRPDSIGIDTWGVDFGMLAQDGSVSGLPRAYRDPYTTGAPEDFPVPEKELYMKTGIQIMDFNSIFQLYRQRQERYAPLMNAERILFIPDLLTYMLTGEAVCEYTVASTSQLLDPFTRDFDRSLLEKAGLDAGMFGRPVMPGTAVGTLSPHICAETGLGQIPVIAVAGHDTASAVAAVPAADSNFAYLSSGTWSLMGIEIPQPLVNRMTMEANFTNEGGVEGTVRLLKNITGMWLLEQSMKEWSAQGRKYTYGDIVRMAEDGSSFRTLIDPDDPRLANPASMTAAISGLCREKGGDSPADDAQTVACIFRSLAHRYREVLDILRTMAPFRIERLHIIGGGSRNSLLNRLTAKATGIPVTAGPAEATAIGNCMIQAKAAGIFRDRWEYRRAVMDSVSTETFMP